MSGMRDCISLGHPYDLRVGSGRLGDSSRARVGCARDRGRRVGPAGCRSATVRVVDDESRVPVKRKVVVSPAEQCREPVSEAWQVDEVQEQPAQPSHEAAQVDVEEGTRQVGDAGVAADDGHTREVVVPERVGLELLDAANYRLGCVLATLDRHLRHLGQRSAVGVCRTGQVADDEGVGSSRQAQIRFDYHPEATGELDPERLDKRMSPYSGCPDEGTAGYELTGAQRYTACSR